MPAPRSSDKMDVDGAESSPISTPPKSPMLGPLDNAATHANSHSRLQSHDAKDGVARPAQSTASDANHNPTTSTTTTKAKRPRKKKESNGDVKVEDVKEKKPRKTKAPAAKKQKMSEGDVSSNAASRQTKLTEIVVSAQNSAPAEIVVKAEASTPASTPLQAAIKGPPTPRPQSSGLNYDPIRGATADAASYHSNTSNGPPLSSPRLFNRASASPAISSLIDPPPSASLPPTTAPPSTNVTTSNIMPSVSTPVSPTAVHVHQSPVVVPLHPRPASKVQPESPSATTVTESVKPLRPAGPSSPGGSHPPSNTSTPGPQAKPARTQATLPLPSGSGLLGPASLVPGNSGPGSSTGRNDGANGKGVDIDIVIPLNPSGGNTVNIAQEITSRYGRDALNPRAAAHRDKLLRVAAAAGALEKGLALGGEGDDLMSLDISEGGGDDSNTEMGGMDDGYGDEGGMGKTLDGKPRKRRKKAEEYDKDDDFIDDTEMAWEQQAVAAKDGFFVYSGPLKTDADKAAERYVPYQPLSFGFLRVWLYLSIFTLLSACHSLKHLLVSIFSRNIASPRAAHLPNAAAARAEAAYSPAPLYVAHSKIPRPRHITIPYNRALPLTRLRDYLLRDGAAEEGEDHEAAVRFVNRGSPKPIA